MTAVREARETLAAAGLRGSFLVRDLDTGDELGIDPDLEFPVASLVKVPLAIATLERVTRGELDGATPVQVRPGRMTVPGPTGLGKFLHPATIAIDDLLYLSTAISDSVAADALFALTPPAAVTAELRRLGHQGITVRHLMEDLTDTPAERFTRPEAHLAHSLAITAGTAGQGHPVPQLDISLANTGSARAFADLVQGVWRPTSIAPPVAARVRELMGDNVIRHRLAPDFASDSARWSSKTGTLLNLRHEVGVVEHADGQAYVVAAFSESRVPAAVQPGAEALLAHVARTLRDQLRMG
ncbi:serine hydrolase [Saccharothrix obliqua]|uniref:serine hydrolase n=1 Tax=Saccharothrix obliqua TaxID=2861747 RepID=UPI001C5F2942|nr:serine hydrolase [Saccharothrix obliqua]MBW4718150.1 class A beta-lactamase-related serine hydrolase [Saccharothrix obliqua]